MRVTRVADCVCVRVSEGTWFQITNGHFMFEIFGRGLWFGIDAPVLFCERMGMKRVMRIGRLAIMNMRRLS